ncbi:MAG: TetR/AcrR family transcriptional regulator [Calditrichaeota bacterium]|nr:TetR/AcrR family transcriptional regulator [Calditrichota bacterium]RQV92766.1 MAG: TetR/AcrR family transcriptional regulator [bacterium]
MNQTDYDSLKENNTRVLIFKTAARLFSEKGYNGVSMREISEMSGISKPAIYYHFKSKEQIYRSLMETALNYNSRQLEILDGKEIPIRDKITELAKMRFRQVLKYPELAKFFVILITGVEKLPFLEEIVREVKDRQKRIFDLIKNGVEKGEFGNTARSSMAADIFLGALLYYIIRQLNSMKIILTDELAEEIVEILFKGWNE